MEKPWPSRPSTPRSPRVESIINMYMEKPLPPTPGHSRLPPSPLGSIDVEISTSPVSPMEDQVFSSKLLRKVSLKRSSASRVPDRLAPRPHMGKDARLRSEEFLINKSSPQISFERGRPPIRFHEIHPGTRIQTPDPSKEPHFTEWKAPVYRPQARKSTTILPTPSRLSGDENQGGPEREFFDASEWQVVERGHGSRSQAEEYRALLHDISLESPESSANPFKSDSDLEPSPNSPIQALPDIIRSTAMSPRISDVLDQPLVPEILDINSDDEEEEQKCSSRTSADSEDSCNTLHDYRRSFGALREHPFRRRPSSKYPEQSLRSSTTLRRRGSKIISRRLSVSKQHRQSIHQGVSDAYESLHRKISSSTQPQQPKADIPREFRNPAIPMTAYQQYGKKAWEKPQGSSKLSKLKGKSWLHSSPEPSPSFIDNFRSSVDISKGKPGALSRDNTDSSVELKIASRTNTERSSKKDLSVGKKLAWAFQNGPAQAEHTVRTDKEKVKQAKKSQNRREELKKQIVVVLPKAPAKF